MKTKILLTISILFISFSISLAQGNETGREEWNDPLPGDPPPPHPPGCIPPRAPVLSLSIPNFISWTGVSGAIGYHIWYGPPGSPFVSPKVFYSSASGVTFYVYYNDLPYGTYTFYVQSFSSGCSSTFSAPVTVTVTNPSPPDQSIDPGNDPYGYDLPELPEDTGGGGGGVERIASMPRDLHITAPLNLSHSELVIAEKHGSGLYPNPVSSTLNVSLPFDISSGAKFLVNDINGRAINLPINISLEGSTQIETSGISPGIYFLTVISGHNNFKQKFIKN